MTVRARLEVCGDDGGGVEERDNETCLHRRLTFWYIEL
jgi:hypothetical protein